jgi:hypothetical protein
MGGAFFQIATPAPNKTLKVTKQMITNQTGKLHRRATEEVVIGISIAGLVIFLFVC